jgi:uncharacterized protein YegL
MTTNDLFITYVLDRSGSMAAIWDDVLGGLNTYIKEQQEAEGKTWFSLITFDTVVEKPFRGKNVNDLPKVTNEHVSPRGGTALLDAIGLAITDADKWLTEHPHFSGKTLIAIMTDGHENSSHEQTNASISKLITVKEEAGWTIAYMGANQDAWAVAQGIGIRYKGGTTTFEASQAGTQSVYRTMSNSTANLRSAGVYEDDQSSKA